MSNLDDFYEHYKDYYKHIPLHLASHLRNGSHILYWIMAINPKTVLEVGAGSGGGSILVKRLIPKAKVIATDIDPRICASIVKFAKKAEVDIIVECCDVLKLPYQDQSFDVCFSGGLMEHFSESLMLQGMREQLRVAKVVLMSVPVLHWFLSGLYQRGDELRLPKITWLELLMTVGTVLDVSFIGPTLEEILMTVAMSNNPTAELPVALGTTLRAKHMRKERI